MKLFMIYIGGKTDTCLIELHDMRFVIAPTLEDTYEPLRQSWWGTPSTLHLDCWGELVSADGHNITLKNEPYLGPEKLFFVNLGGYKAGEFTELHKNVLVVASDAPQAKKRALDMVQDWELHHKDNLFEVETIFCVNETAKKAGLHLHLEKVDDPKPFTFEYDYKPIGKKV